jgi:ribosomal protein S27E
MKGFLVCTKKQIIFGNQMKEDEIGKTCGTVLVEKPEGKRSLEKKTRR